MKLAIKALERRRREAERYIEAEKNVSKQFHENADLADKAIAKAEEEILQINKAIIKLNKEVKKSAVLSRP